MKEFLEDALIGLGLKKDQDDRMGFSTGFAGAIVIGVIIGVVFAICKLITIL